MPASTTMPAGERTAAAAGILGVESSCDESALALFDPSTGIRGQWIASQVSLHREYGGVVPDLAGREHVRNFPFLLERMRTETGGAPPAEVAVTLGPGLAGCLAVGIALARSVHLATGAPLTGINHLRAHAFSPFLPLYECDPAAFDGALERRLPHLGLLVSGGNTLLFLVDRDRSLRVVAETVDDAAGEALDKGAKLLGLPYPGGPEVERAALGGDPGRFAFPRAFPAKSELRFSFSGLKTSLRHRLDGMDPAEIAAARADLCAGYQEAVVGALVTKTRQALGAFPAVSLGLSGGVANNRRLAEALHTLAGEQGIPLLVSRPEHSGDNAAMIAFAAHVDREGRIPADNPRFTMNPSWELAPGTA